MKQRKEQAMAKKTKNDLKKLTSAEPLTNNQTMLVGTWITPRGARRLQASVKALKDYNTGGKATTAEEEDILTLLNFAGACWVFDETTERNMVPNDKVQDWEPPDLLELPPVDDDVPPELKEQHALLVEQAQMLKAAMLLLSYTLGDMKGMLLGAMPKEKDDDERRAAGEVL